MGHLLILTWIKVDFIQNTFTGLEYTNYTIFDPKYVLKFFGKVKNIKALEGFDLMTYGFVVILTHCATQ